MKRQLWTPDEIMAWVRSQRRILASGDLVKNFKMSRQTAARVLRDLVHRGELVKTGATRNASYRVPEKGARRPPVREVTLRKKLAGLSEDRVFEEVALRLGLKKAMAENGYRIAIYSFCEMLNNAIDHSKSASVEIHVAVEKGVFRFTVRDRGIGVFTSILKGFGLKKEEDAVEHLLKGKQTTAPAAHSGQGIFFTSKIADIFFIRSHRLRLKIDNEDKDIALGEQPMLAGTEVGFQVKCRTRKTLKALFESYANEDFEFDRTSYPVVLLQREGAISRSQARRLTLGLGKFARIILDFSQVVELGQGFADEIFRVFQSQHPKVVIEVRNANSAVDFMIRRAR